MDNKKPIKKNTDRPLSTREKAFCIEYAKTGNGGQSVIKAGYKAKDIYSASVIANRMLKRVKIQREIKKLMRPIEEKEKKAIMDAQEVMEHFTAIARGEERDAFGLEIGASDRIKALQEIAKRTIDLENRANGKADNVIQVKLDWGMEEDIDEG